MILLDTNVLICAFDEESQFYEWARETIVEAVAGDGAAINTVSLAEICVGDSEPTSVAERVRSWGVEVLDLPAATAECCAKAYAKYRKRKVTQSGKTAPATPLPDFFIGAHAKIMDWELATADHERFKKYFPSVPLITPIRNA